MVKVLKVIFLLTVFLHAEEIEVQADTFSADENKRVAILKGNVKISKKDGWIKSKELKIDFNKKRKPLKYTASGGVVFDVRVKKSHYKGKSDIFIYEPNRKRYIFDGNVLLQDVALGRKIFAKKVFVDELSGKSKIEGEDKKPIKLIFKIDDKR